MKYQMNCYFYLQLNEVSSFSMFESNLALSDSCLLIILIKPFCYFNYIMDIS